MAQQKKKNKLFTLLFPPTSLFSTVFYSSVSPFTSPLGFANSFTDTHLPLYDLGIFFFLLPSFPTNLPPSYSLISSSSAAECCSSYLCSRLGMFFLLMTSILSLPLHHLLFSVWAAHLPMFPICPPYPHSSGLLLLFHRGLGLGWRQGRAMISS